MRACGRQLTHKLIQLNSLNRCGTWLRGQDKCSIAPHRFPITLAKVLAMASDPALIRLLRWRSTVSTDSMTIKQALIVKIWLDPPENLTVSKNVVFVVENHKPEKVTCSGKGHPALSFVWRQEGSTEPIVKSHILNLGAVPRSASGKYICEASNRHGNETTNMYLNVQCEQTSSSPFSLRVANFCLCLRFCFTIRCTQLHSRNYRVWGRNGPWVHGARKSPRSDLHVENQRGKRFGRRSHVSPAEFEGLSQIGFERRFLPDVSVLRE